MLSPEARAYLLGEAETLEIIAYRIRQGKPPTLAEIERKAELCRLRRDADAQLVSLVAEKGG